MDIYFLGLTAIRLRGKKTALVVDPFTKETGGMKFEKTEADAVLTTAKNSSKTSVDQVSGYRVVVDGPGEYEVGGVSIVGIPISDQTTYVIKMDGISMLHLNRLSRPLTDSELDKYPNIDILFVSVDKGIADSIAKLEPKIVIPMNFDTTTRDAFLKELGKEGVKPQPKLSITKEKLPAELEVILLE